MRFRLSCLMLVGLFSFSFTAFSEQEMVRIVYFYPIDRQIDQAAIQTKIDKLIDVLVPFYKGLVFEKSNNAYVFHTVQGNCEAGDYILGPAEPEELILTEIRKKKGFDLSKNLYLVMTNVDSPPDICGIGGIVKYPNLGERVDVRGPTEVAWAFVYERSDCVEELMYYLAAHELGHALGLGHDFRHRNYIMSYGLEEVKTTNHDKEIIYWRTPYELSNCAKEWLKASRFFPLDPARPRLTAPGVIELSGHPRYDPNTKALHVSFTGSGVPSLHQVQLHLIPESVPDGFYPTKRDRVGGWNKLLDTDKYSLHSCRTFQDGQNDKNQIIFENVNLSEAPPNNMIEIRWIDTYGNIASRNLTSNSIEFKDTQAAVEILPIAEALDLNGDGIVNIQDLILVAAQLGKVGENQADVNGDDVVDIRDLVLVAGGFNADAAAPAAYSLEISTLTPEDIQMWLGQAQHLNLSTASYERGVSVLKRLMETLTPKETVLLPNYPNPFNPETWIPYRLSEPADVTLTIYDLNGHTVRSLVLGHQAAGFYERRSGAVYWDGKNVQGEPVATGVYFYTLTADDFRATRRMLILK